MLLFQGGVMFGTPGYGGQMGFADDKHKLGWAYITNYLNPAAFIDDPAYIILERAMYQAVQNLH